MYRSYKIYLSFLALYLISYGQTGCSKTSKTESGMLPKGARYTVFHGEGGEKISPRHIIKVYQKIYVSNRLAQDGTKGYPGYQSILSSEEAKQNHNYLNLALLKANKGDSLVFEQPLDSIRSYAYMPKTMQGEIKIKVVILDIFDNEKSAEEDKNKELLAFKKKEKERIADYLQERHIDAEETEEGIFIQRLSARDSMKGETACLPGDSCTLFVRYEGKTLSAGKVFDENYSKSSPLSIKLNSRQVIPGFEYALSRMAVGETIIAYIPSMLAYREKGDKMGLIAPFEPVIFKITMENVLP